MCNSSCAVSMVRVWERLGAVRAVTATRTACCASASEVEQRGLECLGGLLDILAAGLAGRAQCFANVREVAKGDACLLSHWLLGCPNGRDRCAFYGRGTRRDHGRWQPERTGCRRSDERHA